MNIYITIGNIYPRVTSKSAIVVIQQFSLIKGERLQETLDDHCAQIAPSVSPLLITRFLLLKQLAKSSPPKQRKVTEQSCLLPFSTRRGRNSKLQK